MRNIGTCEYVISIIHDKDIWDSLTRKVLEIQKCPKCGKEFTEYPVISRDDNATEICPECGVKEAIEAYQKATQ